MGGDKIEKARSRGDCCGGEDCVWVVGCGWAAGHWRLCLFGCWFVFIREEEERRD